MKKITIARITATIMHLICVDLTDVIYSYSLTVDSKMTDNKK
jgi:hypothetical protein